MVHRDRRRALGGAAGLGGAGPRRRRRSPLRPRPRARRQRRRRRRRRRLPAAHQRRRCGTPAARRANAPPARYPMATTQDHFSMEGRHLVRERPRSSSTWRTRTSSSTWGHAQPRTPPFYPEWRYDGLRLGHGDRPERLHRLQRLRRRLPGREQHPGRRQGAGDHAAGRCTGSGSTATTRATTSSTTPSALPPAGALHAVRERPVRAGLPGRGDRRTATRGSTT